MGMAKSDIPDLAQVRLVHLFHSLILTLAMLILLLLLSFSITFLSIH